MIQYNQFHTTLQQFSLLLIKMNHLNSHILIMLLICIFFINVSCDYNWSSVETQITDKITKGYFTGCILGVYTTPNITLFKKAYGTLSPKNGLYAPSLNLDTVFDINFLTQVLGINSALMQLFDQQKFSINDRVSKYIPDFAKNNKTTITLTHLMMHNSGLQATYSNDFGATPVDLLTKIYNLTPQFKQETKYQYSELGYVVLGEVLSKMTNKTIDQALFQVLLESGMRDTKFKPTTNIHLIAPSGYNQGVVQGLPGNRIAHFLGGVAGNAGLFSIIDNVGYYQQLMLNRGKMPIGTRVFSQEVIDLFTTKKLTPYNSTRAFGWDTLPVVDPPCGKKFSSRSYGLSDSFGSYIWSDKDKNVSIVLLAAGGFPIPKTLNYGKAQGEISDAVMTVLGF